MIQIYTIILMLIYISIIFLLRFMKKKKYNFNKRVLTAMAIGIVFGIIVQTVFGVQSSVVNDFNKFLNIFGQGYVRLLQMIVIPLVFVAMTTSVMNVENTKSLSKIAPKAILILLVTVAIAAIIGIASIFIFNIDGNAIVAGSVQTNDVVTTQSSLLEKQQGFENTTYDQLILGIIPTNIFYMFSGVLKTATLSTVLFSMFLGYSILQVRKRNEEKVKPFVDFLNASKEVVLSMVREILKLTPFAVAALMIQITMTNDVAVLSQLGIFIIASYFAIIVMYLVHLLIVSLFGLDPRKFAKKTWPVLVFGFGSRSSMAALPLSIETQTNRLGIDEETASIGGTFATSIGQNGCAGIYPAMLAIMAAQIAGVPITLAFIVKLVVVVVISSFGIAGVGGGATFAAVAVLTIMGLDVTIVALLVSIEALIDMARTALNISDGMLTGLITARSNKTLDLDKYKE